jgi:hypothetical protein
MDRRLALLVALLVVLVAVGVVLSQTGADDDAPSQQEFARQANDICRDARESLDDVGQGAQGAQDIIAAIDVVIEESRTTVAELTALERPSGEAGETAREFVDATRREIVDEGIPELEALREALENQDEQAARESAQRLREIESEESNRAARAVGATACAGRGGPGPAASGS